jgi:hypothetical protein
MYAHNLGIVTQCPCKPGKFQKNLAKNVSLYVAAFLELESECWHFNCCLSNSVSLSMIAVQYLRSRKKRSKRLQVSGGAETGLFLERMNTNKSGGK